MIQDNNKIEPNDQSLQMAVSGIASSKTKFKQGDIVSLKLDENERFWVTRKNGKKCLKMAGCLGWMYFEPENWDDVILRIRP